MVAIYEKKKNSLHVTIVYKFSPYVHIYGQF